MLTRALLLLAVLSVVCCQLMLNYQTPRPLNVDGLHVVPDPYMNTALTDQSGGLSTSNAVPVRARRAVLHETRSSYELELMMKNIRELKRHPKAPARMMGNRNRM